MLGICVCMVYVEEAISDQAHINPSDRIDPFGDWRRVTIDGNLYVISRLGNPRRDSETDNLVYPGAKARIVGNVINFRDARSSLGCASRNCH